MSAWTSSIGFALLACAGAPSAIAEGAVCTRVFDSMIRVIKTPNHTYVAAPPGVK